MRTTYPTDLTDAEWGCLEPHLPAPKATGRPRVYPLREILNAIFYVVRSGCSWRLLPHDLERLGAASTTISGSSAWRWHLGEDAHRPAQASARSPREEPPAQRRHSG